MTTTNTPAAQAGSYRVGNLDLNRSTVSLDQLAEAQRIAPVVCVQNFYNIANRADEAVLAATSEQASRTCRTSRSAASLRCSLSKSP